MVRSGGTGVGWSHHTPPPYLPHTYTPTPGLHHTPYGTPYTLLRDASLTKLVLSPEQILVAQRCWQRRHEQFSRSIFVASTVSGRGLCGVCVGTSATGEHWPLDPDALLYTLSRTARHQRHTGINVGGGSLVYTVWGEGGGGQGLMRDPG